PRRAGGALSRRGRAVSRERWPHPRRRTGVDPRHDSFPAGAGCSGSRAVKRLLTVAVATLLALAACSPSDTDATTTTTSPATTITTTVTGANGDERQLVMPDCGAAPDEGRIGGEGIG